MSFLFVFSFLSLLATLTVSETCTATCSTFRRFVDAFTANNLLIAATKTHDNGDEDGSFDDPEECCCWMSIPASKEQRSTSHHESNNYLSVFSDAEANCIVLFVGRILIFYVFKLSVVGFTRDCCLDADRITED
jgi:hypothetical protein